MFRLFKFSLIYVLLGWGLKAQAPISCNGSNWTGSHWQFCFLETASPQTLYACPLNQGCTQQSQWNLQGGGSSGNVSMTGTPVSTALATVVNGTTIQSPNANTTLSAGGNESIGGTATFGAPGFPFVITFYDGSGNAGTLSAPTLFSGTGASAPSVGFFETNPSPLQNVIINGDGSLGSSGGFQRVSSSISQIAQTASIATTAIITPTVTAAGANFLFCYTLASETTGTAGTVQTAISWTENSNPMTVYGNVVNLGVISTTPYISCISIHMDSVDTGSQIAYTITVTGGGGGSTYNFFSPGIEIVR